MHHQGSARTKTDGDIFLNHFSPSLYVKNSGNFRSIFVFQLKIGTLVITSNVNTLSNISYSLHFPKGNANIYFSLDRSRDNYIPTKDKREGAYQKCITVMITFNCTFILCYMV